MAVPVRRTWALGELSNEDTLNGAFRDVTNFMRNPPGVYLTTNVNVSINNNPSPFLSVPWNTRLYTGITGGMHNSAGGSNHLVNIVDPGIYDIRARLSFNASSGSGTGVRAVIIQKNPGNTTLSINCIRESFGFADPSSPGGYVLSQNVTSVETQVFAPLANGDSLWVWADQNSGASRNILGAASSTPSFFSVMWVSEA